jgi:hypothetical protein
VSVRGPRHCFCCGKVESTTGCVRGMLCDCNQNPGGWCKVCKYCLTHCHCTDEMKQAASDARTEYIKALMEIAERNRDRINRRW